MIAVKNFSRAATRHLPGLPAAFVRPFAGPFSAFCGAFARPGRVHMRAHVVWGKIPLPFYKHLGGAYEGEIEHLLEVS